VDQEVSNKKTVPDCKQRYLDWGKRKSHRSEAGRECFYVGSPSDPEPMEKKGVNTWRFAAGGQREKKKVGGGGSVWPHPR